jgi:uncharacterized protein (DUF1501 family)
MGLNRADDGPASLPGGPPDLASAPAKKKAAANTIETELEPSTKKAGIRADAASGKAVAGFAGWATSAGLKTVQTTWDSQVKTLMARLAAEKGALRATTRIFAETDFDRRQRISGVRSNLDSY